MKSTVQRWFVCSLLLLIGLAQFNLFAGGRGQDGTAAVKKTDMVIMIDNVDLPIIGEKIIPMLVAKFPDINFISKLSSRPETDKVVRAAYAAGETIDIVAYWPSQMMFFVDEGIALDLTPYLNADTQWRNSYGNGINIGKYNDKIYALAYSTVYPMMLINKQMAAKAGVIIKNQWSWQEFIDACAKLKTNLPGVFPIGQYSEWQNWYEQNALVQIWDTEEERHAFVTGQIPFTDTRVVKAFDNIKYLYDNNYLYPGEGALTATNDQIISAFVRERIAIMPYVNAHVGALKRDTIDGAFDIAVLTWPYMGKPSMNNVPTSSDGYFIMSNTKQPDKAVEVLKYLTSPEIMQVLADAGQVVPISGIKSSDPDYAEYGRDMALAYDQQVIQLTPEIFDYTMYHMPANYVLYGMRSLNELEALRQAANRK
jgi:ABC-type glycerol-3-phosphate transport system substrate-binding protein